MDYAVENFAMYRIKPDTLDHEPLCNFTAEITHETRYVDGISSKTMLTITGEMANPDSIGKFRPEDVKPIELPPVTITADEFPGLGWVVPHWGVRAVIRPGSTIKDDIRTFIQMRSNPQIVTIYRNMGWVQKGKTRTMYLHAGGGIDANGNKRSVQVQLPQELSLYDLTTEGDPKAGVAASVRLADLAPSEIGWSLLAGTIAPILGPVDFAIHLAGRTGTFKSEVMSLYQSHFGPKMDARHLPGSWSSTANALEAQAFFAKNAPFVIDDFVPTGTSWQQRAYQQSADKIIRAQGNQAGRARLTDVSSLQQTMYPRGIILSTGEDVPEGHSVRARMLILELSPGDIEAPKLSVCQKEREQYVAGIAAFIQWVAKTNPDIVQLVDDARDNYLSLGHTRTPGMLARLVVSIQVWLQWAGENGYIDKKLMSKYLTDAENAIRSAGEKQASYLEDSDPVDVFTAAIRQTLASGGGHFRTRNGGIPKGAEMLGWTKENSIGELPTWKSRGPVIGWVDVTKDEMYIDVTAGFQVIKKTAGSEITLSKQTLIKRMKDAAALTRTDEGRQRNTVRIMAENHPRQVLQMSIQTVMDTNQKIGEQTGDAYEGEET